jgi:hypothetical protein
VTSLAFAPDGRALTAAAKQGGAKVWLLPAAPEHSAGDGFSLKRNEK